MVKDHIYLVCIRIKLYLLLPASFIAIMFFFSIGTKSYVFFYFEYTWFMLFFFIACGEKRKTFSSSLCCNFSFGHCIVCRSSNNDFYYPSVSSSLFSNNLQAQFEDTKWIIIIRKSKKNRQHNGKRKRTKGETKIYKALHRKLKIE